MTAAEEKAERIRKLRYLIDRQTQASVLLGRCVADVTSGMTEHDYRNAEYAHLNFCAETEIICGDLVRTLAQEALKKELEE